MPCNAELVKRSQRMLTQPHLAQHVLFHSFHIQPVRSHARYIVGLPDSRAWGRVRRQGLTPVQTARRGGIHPSRMKARLFRVIRDSLAGGVRHGDLSQGQADDAFNMQRTRFSTWARQPGLGRTGRMSTSAPVYYCPAGELATGEGL